MDRVSCSNCGRCNRKGKPSVSRFSKYCDENHISVVEASGGLFDWFLDVRNKFWNKRAKYDEETKELKEVNTKGFRPSWFGR